MCPVCLATMGILAIGAASTGGLAALAVKVSRKKTVQEKSLRTQPIGHFSSESDSPCERYVPLGETTQQAREC